MFTKRAIQFAVLMLIVAIVLPACRRSSNQDSPPPGDPRPVEEDVQHFDYAQPESAPPDLPFVDDGVRKYYYIKVHYGTDRNVLPQQDAIQKYGSLSSELTLGVCHVSIPETHKPGDLEAPSKWKLEFKEDPYKHVVLLDARQRERQAFNQSLRRQLEQSESNDLLLFIHGFNVSFEDAARRTAQITYDLGFDGASVMYAWPSRAREKAYGIDRAMATDHSPVHLAQFIRLLREESQARRIHVIAHSMGSEVLCRALRLLSQDVETAHLAPICHEIVLAAPDIWARTFRDQFAQFLVSQAARVTLYASSTDLALTFSSVLHDGEPRAGQAGAGLTVIDGINTVEADALRSGLLNHSYFAELESVMLDLIALLRLGRGPDERCLEPRQMPETGLTYWQFTNVPVDPCRIDLIKLIGGES